MLVQLRTARAQGELDPEAFIRLISTTRTIAVGRPHNLVNLFKVAGHSEQEKTSEDGSLSALVAKLLKVTCFMNKTL